MSITLTFTVSLPCLFIYENNFDRHKNSNKTVNIYKYLFDAKVEAEYTVTILYMVYLLVCVVPLSLRVARSAEKASVPLIETQTYPLAQITHKYIHSH